MSTDTLTKEEIEANLGPLGAKLCLYFGILLIGAVLGVIVTGNAVVAVCNQYASPLGPDPLCSTTISTFKTFTFWGGIGAGLLLLMGALIDRRVDVQEVDEE